MKFLSARTTEADDPAIAVSEILEQLDLEKNTRKHSIGFITCSYDFVESGTVKAICDALPFDVAGCTTLANADSNEAGTILLCLTVLTADDCRFTAALTESLREDPEEKITAAAGGAKAAGGQKPGMGIAFLPMFGAGGEMMLTALDKATDGAPIFGTLACDSDTATYANSFVIYKGEHYKDRMSFILMSGNVNPIFVVTSASEQNLRKQQAVITSSEGNLLKEINNTPANSYFESIGLISGKGVEGMSSVPFVVDYGDGTQPIARAIYGLNEDGSAVCGGIMPEGSTLFIGRMDVDDILLTAEQSIKSLLAEKGINGIIMFPCLGRNMVLATDPLAEVNTVKKFIGDSVPWHLAYSGGECCPVYNKDGLYINRFHNFTFIGCAI